MELKLVLLAGVAMATLSVATLTPAMADDTYVSGGRTRYDEQAGQTRALNNHALEAARNQNGTMSEPGDDNDNDADEPNDGQGGPMFEGPPGPNDLGVEPNGDDQDDDADMDDDATPDDDGPNSY